MSQAVFTNLVGAIADLSGITYTPSYPSSQSEFRKALGLSLGVTLSLSLERLEGFSLGLAARHSYILFQIQNLYVFVLSPATLGWCYHRSVGLSFVLGVGIITPFPGDGG